MHAPTFAPDAPPIDLQAPNLFVNLSGDYTYLSNGYYLSMEAEHEGLLAVPTPTEALDAYVVPLALTKAKAAGIGVPEWEFGDDNALSIPPPLIVYPVNPFQHQGMVIAEPAAFADGMKSLTMSGKYAVVCQSLPPASRVDTVRMVLGQCLRPEYQELALQIWLTFRLPLARVKVIVTENEYLFSAIEPLPKSELTQNEKAIIKEAGLWRV